MNMAGLLIHAGCEPLKPKSSPRKGGHEHECTSNWKELVRTESRLISMG
jgi:hypothetical protein